MSCVDVYRTADSLYDFISLYCHCLSNCFSIHFLTHQHHIRHNTTQHDTTQTCSQGIHLTTHYATLRYAPTHQSSHPSQSFSLTSSILYFFLIIIPSVLQVQHSTAQRSTAQHSITQRTLVYVKPSGFRSHTHRQTDKQTDR